MFGRKAGFLVMMAMTMALFGGCGTNGKLTEDQKRQATEWYNGTVRDKAATGNRNNVTSGGNNLERNTSGMRTDGYVDGNGGTSLGRDIRNAWDNVKNDVNNMGNNTNNGNMNSGTAKNR